MIYLILVAVVFFLHLILKMNWITTIILLGFGFIALPLHRKAWQKQKMNENRFFEASLYMDTVLYAFLKEEKIEGAIRDAALTLPEGTMKETVKLCHERLLMTSDDICIMEESLGEIGQKFPCKRIQDIHEFMIHVEYYGGEIEKPVKLLLEDKGRWEKRIQKAMEERKKKLSDILLSVVASLLICGIILYLPVLNVDISGNWLLQIFTLVVLLADDVVVLKAQKYLSVDWLSLNLMEDEDYYVKKMQEFKSFDEKKEGRPSRIMGSIGLLISVLLFVFGKEWAAALGLFLSIFLFQQRKVGHALLKKKITKEIKYAFPNWLLDLVLLLQSENVHVALQKSKMHVPGVLREELEQLLERLEMEPESSEPYHMFLQDFSIPEVHSAMSGLYGLSIGNSSNGDRQMSELVARNLTLLDVTEARRLSDAGSGMHLLFLAPVLTASFKMVIDMALLMIYFIQNPYI